MVDDGGADSVSGSPDCLDVGLDNLVLGNIWEKFRDAVALGLVDWVVISLSGLLSGDDVVDVPFEDEAGGVSDADLASWDSSAGLSGGDKEGGSDSFHFLINK